MDDGQPIKMLQMKRTTNTRNTSPRVDYKLSNSNKAYGRQKVKGKVKNYFHSSLGIGSYEISDSTKQILGSLADT